MLAKLITGAIWAVCLIAVMAIFVNPATASDPYHGSHFLPWYSQYPADLTSLYEMGNIPTPPYFALHPPVYYSRPVARTYGYGPWAYPPRTKTPDLPAPTPKVIQNKFVPPRKDLKEATKDKTAAAPLRIINPFVTGDEALADASPGRAKIVYPIVAIRGQ